jgi:hypothetical protein
MKKKKRYRSYSRRVEVQGLLTCCVALSRLHHSTLGWRVIKMKTKKLEVLSRCWRQEAVYELH